MSAGSPWPDYVYNEMLDYGVESEDFRHRVFKASDDERDRDEEVFIIDSEDMAHLLDRMMIGETTEVPPKRNWISRFFK
jgi:hypothetical protein